ncbi:MAG: GNAT family N-acetyltransferase [candidate division Zixibacteria bacterium]|nr:GNAT family N-acetyltransferase [candidate division Zixibacteria bacterium]
MHLFTHRLELVAATLDHICAELESTQHLATMLDAQIDPEWPPGEYDRQAQEFFRDRMRAGGEAVAGWYVWYVILRGGVEQGSVLVGTTGFLGPPNDRGEVEIGYSILPAWEGKGYATELVQALVGHAFQDLRVRKVIAHTTADNPASQRVLEKAKFRRVGEGADPGQLRFEVSRITGLS